MRKKFAAIILGIVMVTCPVSTMEFGSVITAEAHSGRTDSSGGHKDNKNKSGLGSYHYHCGGHPAHLHTNGVCPYSSQTADTSSAQTAGDETELIKKVQQALNEKGYDCGEADGIMGEKSKQALMNFQTDNGLTADGIIGDEVKTALGI